MGSCRSPNGQQHTLTFMVAGTVGVRVTEIPGRDGAVHGSHDLAQFDIGGAAGEYVSTTDTPFGSDNSRAFERQEDLFKIRLRQSCAFGDFTHRGRGFGGVQRQGQKRPGRIVAAGRDAHEATLDREAA